MIIKGDHNPKKVIKKVIKDPKGDQKGDHQEKGDQKGDHLAKGDHPLDTMSNASKYSTYIKSDLKDDDGRLFCGSCGIPYIRRNMTQRHFKVEECNARLLLNRDNLKLAGDPWNPKWIDFLPEDVRALALS